MRRNKELEQKTGMIDQIRNIMEAWKLSVKIEESKQANPSLLVSQLVSLPKRSDGSEIPSHIGRSLI